MGPSDIENRVFILLVDDEPRIHEMIGGIFNQSDRIARFDSYYDPLSFLESLNQMEMAPDMVLLDVHFENSGLTGIDILPFIREKHPYLPIVLLTGMEGKEIEDAQDFECTYFIPKPVNPDHLLRMVFFYLGKAQKSGSRIEKLSRDLDEHKALLDVIEEELSVYEKASNDMSSIPSNRESKAFERVMEVLLSVLKTCDMASSFSQDLKKLFTSDFKLLKRVVGAVTDLDSEDMSKPGANIHKYYGVDHVFSFRVSKKARLFFYLSPKTRKRKLLRFDPEHDTKGMDKWLKANARTYETDL
ncbi:MAG: response regulator [Proteobacteria bacterium]|nr:response regulator [Pseudomonadota bacterium]